MPNQFGHLSAARSAMAVALSCAEDQLELRYPRRDRGPLRDVRRALEDEVSSGDAKVDGKGPKFECAGTVLSLEPTLSARAQYESVLLREGMR